MAGAPVAGGVLEAHPLHRTRIISREFQLLDRHRQFGSAIALSQPVGPEPDLLAEAFALGSHFGELDHCIAVTKIQRHTDFLFADKSLLKKFHGATDCCTEGDGVHTGFVADIVGLGNRSQVRDAAGRTDRPQGFIFRAFAITGVLVIDNLGHPSAADDAAHAALVAFQVSGCQCLTGNLLGPFEGSRLGVAGRQPAALVHDVDQYRGSQCTETLTGDRVFLEHAVSFESRVTIRLGVGNLNTAGTAYGNRLEVLAAHDHTDPTAPGSTMLVINDTGIMYANLSGRADAGDLGITVEFTQNRIFRLVG